MPIKTLSENAVGKEKFVKKSRMIHGDKFDYSSTIYINSTTKVNIHCNTCHKNFDQSPNAHANGNGCPHCATAKRSCRKLTTEQFIQKAQAVHGVGKFDYSQTTYSGNRKKLKIKCNGCLQVFEQFASNHMKGFGCQNCRIVTMIKNIKHTKESFVEKAKSVHQDKYDYTDSVYNGINEKIQIYCNCCKQHFMQTAHGHLIGSGCPTCRVGSDKARATRERMKQKAKRMQTAQTIH